MSVKSWLKEFYPKPAASYKHRPDEDCLKHSIKKWVGLIQENLKKHNVEVDHGRVIDPRCANSFLRIGNKSCALCVKHHGYYIFSWSRCDYCSLNRYLHNRCSGYDASPYTQFIFNNNPKPMIYALKKALEMVKKEQANKAKSYFKTHYWDKKLGEYVEK